MSSPPLLQGEKSFHLWSVPGATNNTGIGLATYFACTNANTAAVRIGVEVFGPTGVAVNDPSATSLSVAAEGSVLFGTNLAGALPVDGNLSAAYVGNGSARVLATAGRGIACSAVVADTVHVPPTAIGALQVIKKTAQKGQ